MKELNNLLVRYQDIASKAEQYALVEDLVDLINKDPRTKNYLEAWIKANGRDWLENKVTGLSAVLEVSARYHLSVGKFFAKVLLYPEALDLVTRVTVQRIRLLDLNKGLCNRLYKILKMNIPIWLEQGKTDLAVQGFMSLPYVANGRATDWLCDVIANSEPKLANAVCQGVLTWACGNIKGVGMNSEISGQLYKAVVARIDKERVGDMPYNIDLDENEQLFTALHWVLGSVVYDITSLNEACDIFARAFENPSGLEDAASVRSSRILLKRFGTNFTTRLQSAFEKRRPTPFVKMWECISATEYKGI